MPLMPAPLDTMPPQPPALATPMPLPFYESHDMSPYLFAERRRCRYRTLMLLRYAAVSYDFDATPLRCRC